MYYLAVLLGQFIAVMVVITLHEFAHAYAAYKCGDPTAKMMGRLSLNPLKHFDLLGMVLFAFVGFGWAKPVPVNPDNFRNFRKGNFWTSVSGVLVNYISAFLFYPLFLLTVINLLPLIDGTYMYPFLHSLTRGLVVFSLTFCIFNLLPLYPLDGFGLLESTTTKRGKLYWFLRRYGQLILLGLVIIHYLSSRIPFLGYIDILGYILNFAVNIFGWPITAFWTWIFGI